METNILGQLVYPRNSVWRQTHSESTYKLVTFHSTHDIIPLLLQEKFKQKQCENFQIQK